MVDGIGYAGVLGDALVGEVYLAVFVNGYVFEKGIATDGVVDVGFAVFVEVDNLGVAAAFEIEDAVVVPAVFVIADEQTLGVGRKCGFACSAEAEEDGGVFAFHIGVGAAVHRSDAAQRQEVVHHREHTFLHFATIPGVDDYLLAAGNVEYNGGFAVQTQLLVVRNFGLGGIVYDEVGGEVGEFVSGGADEHIGYEVSLPCNFHNEAHCHTSVFVCTAEAVNDVEFLVAELIDCDLFDSFPSFLACGLVVVFVSLGCPPNGVLGVLVHYDEFVFGRAAGVDAGHYVYSTKFGDFAFLVAFKRGFGLFVKKLIVGGVVHDFGGAVDTILGKRGLDLGQTLLFDFFEFAHCC